MEAFTELDGLVAPLDRSNIDTDAIIPKQFLKSVHKTGYGPFLFDEWRYEDIGRPGQDCSQRPLKKDFILNRERYQGASILLTRFNFGCGSSREHAVWALREYGFRCVIAESFADIFYSNCGKNGVLAVSLDAEIIEHLFKEVLSTPGYRLRVNLTAQTITTPSGENIFFDIDASLKDRLLNGLDDIGMTLQYGDDIRAYEQRRATEAPWLFPERN
ncbi:MAG: 3-isopropylmalate dehydratase small subunit [Gammaproteobacteria bacterium]